MLGARCIPAQLSVHDSGNSKLGYSWPGLPAATWPPLLCHTGTLSPAAAPPWLHHRHHSRLVTRREIRTLLGCGEWSRWRQGPHSSSAVLQCCRRGHHPGPGPACSMGTIAAYSHTRGGIGAENTELCGDITKRRHGKLGHWNDKPALSLESAPQ